jgi:hypothetical protein
VVSWKELAGACALAAVGALPALGGEQPSPTTAGGTGTWEWTPPPPPPVMKVLDGVEYVLPSEGRSVIVEKVEAPPLPVPPPPPPARTPEEIEVAKARWAEAARRYRERNRMLMLSCTVYDHQATLLRWTHQGRQYRAWSNIDFNHFCGQTAFESPDGSIRFNLWLGIGNHITGTRMGFSGRTMARPQIPELPADGPGFVVVEGDANDEAALSGMRAVHDYYRTNGARLKASYEARLLYQKELAAWIKANPPPPRDTILMHSGIVRPESPVERRMP